MVIILAAIGGYFISGYCRLYYYRPLVVILLFVNNGYSIDDDFWLFKIILQLLMVFLF